MKTLLRIDSSARIEGSYSRTIADHFEYLWKQANPTGKIVYRDLAKQHLPHIDNATIQGFYSKPGQLSNAAATALSDELVAELLSADEIVISSPLYNFNIPSNLKAYIDQVTRINRTFKIAEDGAYSGLLSGKKAYLFSTKGGVYKNTDYEQMDIQDDYLKTILNFIGIEDIHLFSLEGVADQQKLHTGLEHIKTTINQLFINTQTI
ncbi:MAG: FMN-dependent NADH-azoreductase [Sphingobacteriaceae bacterium]